MDAVYVAIAAGLALGLGIGYRFGKVVYFKVGGPYARKPLIIGLVAAGTLCFLVPASIFAILGAREIERAAGGAVSSGSPTVLLGITAGIALVIASTLVIAVFASALCGRLIEEWRPDRRPPD